MSEKTCQTAPNMEQLYITERIRLLHSQINVHFLYTTLETMRGMLAVGETQVFKTAITQLAALYRYCSSPDVLSTVAGEVEAAQNYFWLISCIMPNEIALTFDIDKELFQRRIPRMLLQPLVENALLHGYQHSKLSEGTILVRAEERDNLFILSMENDGIGIPAEKIMELNAVPAQQGSHIGVANISERIRLLYPQTGSLEICSDGIRGATVLVQF